jgi:hypothetical protein
MTFKSRAIAEMRAVRHAGEPGSSYSRGHSNGVLDCVAAIEALDEEAWANRDELALALHKGVWHGEAGFKGYSLVAADIALSKAAPGVDYEAGARALHRLRESLGMDIGETTCDECDRDIRTIDAALRGTRK